MPKVNNVLGRLDLFIVPFSELRLHPNPRFEFVEIPSLVAYIKNSGEVPGIVSGYRKDGLFYIVDGSQRYEAMRLIAEESGGELISCKFQSEPRGGYTDDIRLKNQINLNETGQRLSTLEKSFAVKKFIDEFGYTEKQVCEAVNFSMVYVRELLKLANSPDKFIEKVKKNKISATLAMDLIRQGKVEDFLDGKIGAPEEKPKKDDGLPIGGFYDKKSDGGEDRFIEESNKIESVDTIEKRKERITKKNLEQGNTINSWSVFRDYSNKVPWDELFEGKLYSPREVFEFVVGLKNNELNMDNMRDFFMATKEIKERKTKHDLKEGEISVERTYPE